ncbi:MAG: hypothetical protein R6T96_12920 [Longimicrobiales bacterium]
MWLREQDQARNRKKARLLTLPALSLMPPEDSLVNYVGRGLTSSGQPGSLFRSTGFAFLASEESIGASGEAVRVALGSVW